MSETDEARVRRYTEAIADAESDSIIPTFKELAEAAIAVADEEQAARWEELKELAQQVADTRRRAEATEAELERLTRECLDREATETDARERLRRAEAIARAGLADDSRNAGWHALEAILDAIGSVRV